MRLMVIRLDTPEAQDLQDLAKIWPDFSPQNLTIDPTHRLFAARFNDRLLAAVSVTLRGSEGILSQLSVREATHRRSVGSYLLEEVIAQNPGITTWWLAEDGVENHAVMTAFMQAMGFSAQNGGWRKQL